MIENGNKVMVKFYENDVFPFQCGGLEIECVVINMPRGNADLLQLEYTESDGNKIIFSVNPTSPAFVGMYRTTKESE